MFLQQRSHSSWDHHFSVVVCNSPHDFSHHIHPGMQYPQTQGTRPLTRRRKAAPPPARPSHPGITCQIGDTISRPKKLIFMALHVILFLNEAHDIDVGLLFNHNSY